VWLASALPRAKYGRSLYGVCDAATRHSGLPRIATPGLAASAIQPEVGPIENLRTAAKSSKLVRCSRSKGLGHETADRDVFLVLP